MELDAVHAGRDCVQGFRIAGRGGRSFVGSAASLVLVVVGFGPPTRAPAPDGGYCIHIRAARLRSRLRFGVLGAASCSRPGAQRPDTCAPSDVTSPPATRAGRRGGWRASAHASLLGRGHTRTCAVCVSYPHTYSSRPLRSHLLRHHVRTLASTRSVVRSGHVPVPTPTVTSSHVVQVWE